MKAPVLSVRRHVDPAAAEAFLAGQPYPAPKAVPELASPPEAVASVEPPLPAPAAAPPTGPSEQSAALGGRRVHERKDGRRVRRTTLLLDEELAKKLDLASATQGVDKTAIMQAALRAWLAAQQ